jgi:membrane fusion protein, multidrug efflux system
MSKRNRLISGMALLAAVGIIAVFAFQFNREPRAAVQPRANTVPVSVAPVRLKSLPVRLVAIGNVEAHTTVAVKARVDGEIEATHFKEGDEVKQGALLFQIDPRPYQAMLQQAEAALLRDQALLDRARAQDERYKDLLGKEFISKDAYEQVRTNTQTAEATVAADRAAVESASLQLGYCTIRSPVTGYAGKIMIQQGNLIKANDAGPLVTINQVVPVFVSFAIPEQSLADVRGYQAKGELQVDAALANSDRPPMQGKITFIDNGTDLTTGTIKLKAEFPNVDKTFWPGQFVNVSLILHQQQDALVLPSAAVQNGPNGQYVYVVGPDQTVALRSIKVARTEGNETVAASGLAAGEQVVTVGQLRLSPGARVSIVEGAKSS